MAKIRKSKVYFASAIPERIDRDLTLPARFVRLLEKTGLRERVRGRRVAVKMHLGWGMGYSTIHPFFVRLLVDHIRSGKPRDVFVTDNSWQDVDRRGYAPQTLGARIVPTLGRNGRDAARFPTGWPSLPEVEIGRPFLKADFLVNFSHVKGHGDCGFGGACKNLAMGCVTEKTRAAIHALEGTLEWSKKLCTRCKRCVRECKTGAISFTKRGKLEIFWHHCRMCRHCMLICPAKAITIGGRRFDRFQDGLARVAKVVLDRFAPGCALHINVLADITIFCDCWGLTTPAIVPDVGIYAGDDIVAVDDASLRAIRTENLIPGSITPPFKLGPGRHLFEKIHSRDPFKQVRALAELKAGADDYRIITVP